jgi:hypothetical protein
MDVSKAHFLKADTGQSSVEYILLLVVLVVVGLTLFKSRAFTDFFGPNSAFFQQLKDKHEFTYRHTVSGKNTEDNSNLNNFHESYIDTNRNATRFILSKGDYVR